MATILTQKQRKILLDIYRNSNCCRNVNEYTPLEKKGLVVIRDIRRVDLTTEGIERARMLELNEQRRG